MRFVTYNIHGWRTADDRPNVEQIANVLAGCQADFIGLNEVYHPTTDGRDATTAALEILADALGMNFVFGPCLRWPATQDLPDRSYGNAFLSRYPIIASAAHHLSAVEGKEQRGLLEARVILPDGSPLTAYVTHLDHTNEEVRLIQLRSLRSWTVRDRNRSHVVMGDFNAVHPWDYGDDRQKYQAMIDQHPPSAYLLEEGRGPQVIPQMKKAGYGDSMELAGKPGLGTFIPATVPVRLDYVWVSKTLADSVLNCVVVYEPEGSEASDHRPVLAEIMIRDSST